MDFNSPSPYLYTFTWNCRSVAEGDCCNFANSFVTLRVTMATIIKDALVLLQNQLLPRDVSFDTERGVITKIADCITPREEDTVISAPGCWLTPGYCDLHVHFRQPGQEYKETIASGCKAASAGGFTTVCTMPNLSPAPDSVENLEVQKSIIRSDATIDVLPYATITTHREGNTPVDFAALAPLCVGFSDDGSGVQDENVMKNAMTQAARHNALIAAHCEVNSLLHNGYIHAGEYARRHGHRGISSQSEWEEVKRDIQLAKETGARLHICHVSTAESLEFVRKAKKEGVKVTCETAPHYLAFCQDDLQEEGRWKMNPPLRDLSDKTALLTAIADGTVDAVATDHAPHSDEEKSRGLEKSAMGVVGLETSAAALYTYCVLPGNISEIQMLNLLIKNPREIIRQPLEISEGSVADLTIFNPAIKWTVHGKDFMSAGSATPFEGKELTGKTIMTIKNGKIIYAV